MKTGLIINLPCVQLQPFTILHTPRTYSHSNGQIDFISMCATIFNFAHTYSHSISCIRRRSNRQNAKPKWINGLVKCRNQSFLYVLIL